MDTKLVEINENGKPVTNSLLEKVKALESKVCEQQEVIAIQAKQIYELITDAKSTRQEPQDRKEELQTLLDKLQSQKKILPDETFNKIDAFLTPQYLDKPVWVNDLLKEYMRYANDDLIDMRRFHGLLKSFCRVKGYTLNPDCLFRNETEKACHSFRLTRRYTDGHNKQEHFWYIQSKELPPKTIERFHDNYIFPADIQTMLC